MPAFKTDQYRKNLLKVFDKEYPDPKSELNFKNNYQLLVAVILSAQCTDKKVNQVTPALFEKYPAFEKLAEAKTKEIEKILRPINYYITKSKNLIAMGKIVTEKFKGKVPQSHEDIVTLPGVGRKTANVVLGEMGVIPTFPVDTHVMRVSKRLGLSTTNTPDKIEEELKKQFAPETWRKLHHWLILHGRRICKAQSPDCPECPLNKICPSAGTDLRKQTAVR